MTKLYYADELNEIAKQCMSEEAKDLLDLVAKVTLEQAKVGDYEVSFATKHMKEIEYILKRKGYTIDNQINTDQWTIKWD